METPKDRAEALQAPPAVQRGDTVADIADSIECYADYVDANLEARTCTAWDYTCSSYGFRDPSSAAACLVTAIACVADQTTYTAVTTCREVCDG